MTTISFEGVSKNFGAVSVLDGVDLTIHSREFFTFVGDSGCGKTTALNLIAGLEKADAGVIRFDGQTVNDVDPGGRDVAMVFQSYALYPHMTVYENIAFPLRVRKWPREKIDAAVRAAAANLGLDELLDRKPSAISGGQRQRVALGRAIVRRPRVFLMDEPLSNLDARLRVAMRLELKRLHAQLGITTVYVTHDQEEALSLSDRIAVLRQGRLEQVGAPGEVYHRPANIYVAEFIGSPPMNFIGAGLLRDIAPAAATLGEFEGVAVLAGIRPADTIISDAPSPGALEADTLMIEPAGAQTWVDCRWRGVPLKGAAAPGAEVRPGAKAYVSIPAGALHFFDKGSGRRLG